ncbi:DUF2804 domain-containing protein [Sansalvadorimonas sp. 2012CJ34-2]|uniref:DUF2804 domain-containing protein n=1 Tax=Parendozoicomonas callyspongiae TaxID=2942213 RepID=A0ABT0PL73_9GAMM|nr:DUF2804 domain-containing protein [Sansalvadorimonas sp. 2012CJ34-2]MCL6271736.1 DUF2804 domain-containing protein [Sansalvadorimonas sp. 2012CJ34-2]
MTENAIQLIDNQGRLRQGLHQIPVSEINYRDFHLRTPMGHKAGALRQWFGFNQFQFTSIISPELIVGTAIVDTKLAVISFVYIYHPSTGKLYNYQFKAPGFGSFSQTSLQPDNGHWFFRMGKNTVEIKCQNHKRTLLVRLKDGTVIDMTFEDHDFEPIRCATRADLNGFSYTQKMAGIPCQGRVSCKAGEYDLAEIQACASLDWTAGYLKRRCFWNWICLSSVLPDGRSLGLNGACFTNESSFTENGFWIDGKLNKTAGIAFNYDSFDLYKPWHIYSTDGMIDLTFEPEGTQTERNNFIIMASNFHQMFGRFSGNLITSSGEKIEIEKLYGFTEEHYAKW